MMHWDTGHLPPLVEESHINYSDGKPLWRRITPWGWSLIAIVAASLASYGYLGWLIWRLM